MLLLPVLLSVIATVISSVFLGVLAAVLLLLFCSFMPLFHNNEPKWVFLLTFLCAIPLNIKLIMTIAEIIPFVFGNIFLKISGYPLVYIVLLCIEEIVMCIFTSGLVQVKRKGFSE